MTLEKQKQDKIKAILKFINEHENFLITTHINSDGDALASVLGCSMFLEKLAKGYKIILDDQMIDPKYSFLKNWSKIQSYTEDQKEEYLAKVDAALVFDAPDNKRIGIIYDLINNKIPTTKIDHHPSEFVFGPADWIDSSASSASAMLYEIIDNSSIETDEFDIFISLKDNESLNLDQVSEYLRSKLRIKPKVYIIGNKELVKKQFPNNVRKPLCFIDKRV